MTEEERQVVLATMSEEDRRKVAMIEHDLDLIASGISLMIHGALYQEKSKEEVDVMIDEAFDRHLKKFVDAGMTTLQAASLRHYIMTKVIAKGKEYCFEMFGEVAGHA